MLGNLCGQLYAVALVAVIALKLVGVLLEHHIRVFLAERRGERERGLWVRSEVRRALAWKWRILLTSVNFGEVSPSP